MKSLVIRAPLLTLSGYGTHSRQVFKWARQSQKFSKILTQPVPWGMTTWLINPDDQDGLVGDIMTRTAPPESANSRCDVSIQLILPNEWDPNLAKINIGMTAAVETDRCNPEWINACNRMHAIIVPSNHTKSVLENTGRLHVPIYVVAESYIEAIDSPTKDLDLELNTNFNFLTIGQITGQNPENDRKNMFYLVKWFCEVFKSDEDVGLIIKTNSGKNTKIDKSVTEKMMSQLLKEVREGPYPRVHLVHGSMSEEEISSIYKHPSVKAYVSLTRGEGFGLPLLEAAASGVPIIVTNWSAHLDFLSKGKFIPIDYELKDIDKSRIDNQVFMQGSKWAHAKEEDFKKRIEKFKKSSAVPKQWAEELKKTLRKEYSQKSISEKYEKVFSEIIK